MGRIDKRIPLNPKRHTDYRPPDAVGDPGEGKNFGKTESEWGGGGGLTVECCSQ